MNQWYLIRTDSPKKRVKCTWVSQPPKASKAEEGQGKAKHGAKASQGEPPNQQRATGRNTTKRGRREEGRGGKGRETAGGPSTDWHPEP